MIIYDFCLAWEWRYDRDFVRLLEERCRARNLSFLQIVPDNLERVLHYLTQKQISFRAFFDRASEDDPRFMPVVQWARENAEYRINPHELACRAWDKATMHLELISAGLHAPYTIILPPYYQNPILPPIDISPLGNSFIIKPAHGGGGMGVIREANSLNQVLVARKEFPSDKYLLQARVLPTMLDSRPAWFRVIWCAGEIYPCWWDPHTHIYTVLTKSDAERFSLTEVYDIAACLAKICGLDLFSTEVALTPEGRFVVVDYVNDPIDIRLQTETPQGVPKEIAQAIAQRLVEMVVSHCPPLIEAPPPIPPSVAQELAVRDEVGFTENESKCK